MTLMQTENRMLWALACFSSVPRGPITRANRLADARAAIDIHPNASIGTVGMR